MGRREVIKSDSDPELFVASSKSKKKSEKKSETSDASDASNDSTESKFANFICLQDDHSTEIENIYHLSDIHIRNTQRHAEYREVFTRTYRKLRSLVGTSKSSSLIVVTGDIMHTKTELSPESFKMAQDFLRELSEIAPLIVIPGNHDCNLSNRDRLDALTPIISGNVTFQDLYYLKKSGFYQYHNIVFGVTSVFDDVLVKANRLENDKWKKIRQKNKYKIALYHGPVHGSTTDVGYRMHNEQLIVDDFQGYDFVMLGDIHKYQYMDENQRIAYAGSLIQQSYGEKISGHGVLQWNLADGSSNLHEIKNDYGYCTVRIVDGVMVETNLPKKPRIRFILENTNQVQYQEVVRSLENKHSICEIVKESTLSTIAHRQKSKTSNVTTHAYATQLEVIEKYLTREGLDDAKRTEIMQLHEKIYHKLFADRREQIADAMHNATNVIKWKILELHFSNTLSYGKDNYINFAGYDTNRVIGIVAPNHYGKSAILDIILFCLFDKFSRGDRRDILNKNEKTMFCSLLFSVGAEKYLIERKGQRSANGLTVKIDVDFYHIKTTKRGEERVKLNGLDKNDTNRKISELIGDYKDYLTTCFCLQQGQTSNFIDMTNTQKKEYLNEILRLNVFESCHQMAKDRHKELVGQLKAMEKDIGTKTFDEMKEQLNQTGNELKNIERKIEMFNDIMNIINDNPVSSPDPLIQYHDLKGYNTKDVESILESMKHIEECLSENQDNTEYEKLQNELGIVTTTLHELESVDMSQLEKEHQELTSRKEDLISQIFHVDESCLELNVDELTQELTNLQSELVGVQEVLDNHSKEKSNVESKIARIEELQELVKTLRRQLKPVDEGCHQQLEDCTKELNAIFERMMNNIDSLEYQITEKQRQRIIHQKEEKKQFSEHLNVAIGTLENIELEPVQKVIGIHQQWIEEYQKWKTFVDRQLSSKIIVFEQDNELISKLAHQKIKLSHDCLTKMDNVRIEKEIEITQAKLDGLIEFKGSQKEFKLMQRNRDVLQERISQLNARIESNYTAKANDSKNKKLNGEIDVVKADIEKCNSKKQKHNREITNTRKKIMQLETQMAAYKAVVERHNQMKHHLVLLNKCYYTTLEWQHQTNSYNNWNSNLQKLKNCLHDLEKEKQLKQSQLEIYREELKKYMQVRQDYDTITAKSNLYQLYVQVMNYNGLPYEMLKTYLPLIETDVNQILHAMVNFNIEFVFQDDANIERQRAQNIKANAGCVNVNISRHGARPYNVQLASGFERFIIGLAIRMTLCQISLTAKPNFLIIDEGWSCLDTENLNNIGPIMNYIKSQYEHVIVISHLEELKGQADYVINIEKQNGYSKICTGKSVITARKKRQVIKV